MKQLGWLGVLLLSALSAFSQNGVITGKVVDAINNEPLPYTNVLVIGTDIGTTSDLNGNFTIEGLEPGLYSLKAQYVGFQDKTIYEVLVTNSKPAVVEFKMEEAGSELDEVVVKADPFKKSAESLVSVQTLGIAEIERNPGANRDISRVIQSLPGVASTVAFRNDIIIRGGGPNENRFYLDGVEIPVINHFATQGAGGGPVGIINVNFINEATLYTGAWPANRGNALSSVMELNMREGRTDRLGGTFTLGATDVGLTAEGPLGKKANFIVSARRSYLQFLFDVIGLPFLPTYTDVQFKVKYRPSSKHEFTLIGLGAYDEFALNLDANETEEQQFLLDNLPVTPQWNYTRGLVYKNYRDNSYTTVVLSRSVLDNTAFKYEDNDDSDPDNLILDYNSQEAENKLRIENTSRWNGFKINVGGNYELATYTNSTYNKLVTPFGVREINFESDLTLNKWGLFGQISRSFFSERLTVSLGVRSDAIDYSDQTNNLLDQLSPRLSASYKVTDRLSVNGSIGRYYQLPPYTVMGYRDSTGRLVNRDNGLTYMQSDHLVAGMAYTFPTNTRISVEGFYKGYSNYPFLTRDSLTLANLGGDFGVVGNEPATSSSDGRAYGVEVFIQQKLYKGFYGLLAYTLLWSEFEDKDGNLVPSAWDSRQFITATAGKKFNNGWELGVRFRYGGGNPYTPIDAERSSLRAFWDIRGQGIPDYDRLNTERLRPFYNLDIRVDKKYYFDKWSLNLYFDVQNVTGYQADSPPALLVERDDNGEPLVDPNDPARYQTKFLQATQGTVLPTLGIILEY